MPRFVILFHQLPAGSSRDSHWDLMLETETPAGAATLRTWALPEPPGVGRTMTAEALADHRPMYLDYEGEVSDGRGWVTRWDCGSYETLGDAPCNDGNDDPDVMRQWLVRLAGNRLACRAMLAPLCGGASNGNAADRSEASARAWSISFLPG